MTGHGIVSARYDIAEPFGGYPSDACVLAVHEKDGEQSRRINDDVGGGGMLAYLAGGGVIDPYVAPPVTEAVCAAAIQLHIDATAKSRGYADGVALAGYSTSAIPTWAAEAASFIAWRDQVWVHAYTELAKVQGGQRAVPTIDGLIAELPTIKWPE